jgi:hypothetical protein
VNQKVQIGSKEGTPFFLDVAESRLALQKDDMRCVKHDAHNEEDDDHAANFT